MVHSLGKGIKLTENWNSSNDLVTKFEYSKIKGLKLTGELLLKTKNLEQKVTLSAAYSAPKVNFNAKVNPLKASVAADVTVKALEKVFVGVKADVNSSGLASQPTAAISYRGADFSIFAASNGKKVFGDAHHKLNASTQGAFVYNFNLEKSSVDVGLGVEHKANGNTYKVRALSKGAVGVSFATKVSDDFKLTLAAEVNSKSLQIDGHKVGVSVEYN